MKRAGKAFVILVTLGVAALLAGSFAGPLHPLGDSLAVFRFHLVAALLVCALLWARAMGRGAVVIALAAILAALPAGYGWVRPAAALPDVNFVLYQKNMLFALRDTVPLADDIREAAPDALTLQEVTDRNAAMLDALADILPTRHVCPYASVGGVAVASRWPEIPGTAFCREGFGVTGVQVRAPTGPLWIVAIHLHWPYPHSQWAQAWHLRHILADLEGPVVIGGDFNMVPWGSTVTSIGDVVGAHRIGRTRTTFPRYAPLLPLAIDHVLAPNGASGETELRPRLGSDHRGLLARIALPG